MPLPLRTSRLLLRAPLLSDVDAFLAIYADHETLRHIGTHARWTGDLVRRRNEQGIRVLEDRGYTVYTVERRSDEAIIGQCGLWPADDGTPELACVLSREVWGRGYGLEAIRAVVRHACGELGLARMTVRFEVANTAMAKLWENHPELGFTFSQEYVCERSGQRMRQYTRLLDLKRS
ncbi:GNAT family N-acetyltransferase [Streptomyces sp. NPDC046261]|uniref:GNAT family N-acetyltransferase n=1 Tax=Streptomyces sp. NPDC046261 TaxID=3157200 RepID=UPI0033C3E3CF